MADVTYTVDADFSDADKATAQFAQRTGQQLEGIKETLKAAFSFDAISGAGDFLSGFAEDGVAFRDSLKQLQVQTGLTGDEFDSMKGRAEDAFLKGVGESVDEAVAAIATAQKSLGKILPEDQIAQFTADAAQLGKVYDKDVNEVIGKSRTFLQNFNLEGEKGAGLISLALRDSGNAMDDTLDTLDEYSQLWKETGLSAEGAVQLITSGVQAGARDTDKIADSLKELQIRLKADDTGNALKDISAPVARQLEVLKNAAQSGQLTVSEFAQQSAAKIEEAFQKGQIGETLRSQLQVAIAGTPAEDLGADLYAKIFSAPIDTAGIQANAQSALDDVRKAAGEISIFEGITRQFDLIKTKVSEFAAPLVAGLGGVMSTVGQLGPGISLITQNFDKIKDLAGGLGKSLGSAIGPAAPWVLGITAAVGLFTLLYNEVKPFRDFIDGLVDAVGQVWTTIQPALSAFGDLLLTIGGVVLDMIIAPFEVAWDVITALGEAIFGTSGPSLGMTEILKVLGAIVGKLVTAFKGAQEGIKKIGDVIQGAKAQFTSFIKDIGGGISDLFSLNFEGFIDKIQNAGLRAKVAAQNAMNDATAKRQNSERFASSIDPILIGFNKDLEALATAFGKDVNKFDDELAKVLVNRRQAFFRGAAFNQIEGADLTEAQKEFEAKLKESIDAARAKLTKDPPGGKGPPVRMPIKVTVSDLDLTSSINGIINETKSRLESANRTLAELKLTGIEDAFRLQSEDIAKKAQDATDKLLSSVGALKIQLGAIKDEADKKTVIKFDADPTDAVAAVAITKQAALDLIASTLKAGEEAIARESAAAAAKLTKEFAGQRIDAALKDSQELAAMELTLLKAKETLITGNTVEEIKRRGQLRTEQTRIQLDQELNEQLRTLPRFQAAFADAIAAANQKAITDATAAASALPVQFRAAALKAAQSATATPAAIGQIFEDLKTQFITTDATASAIFDAMQVQLRAIGIETKGQLTELQNAELASLRQNNVAFIASFALRTAALEAFGDAFDTEVLGKLQEERDALLGEQDEIWQDYLSGRIESYGQFRDDFSDISQQIADKDAEIQAAAIDGWAKATIAIGAAFGAVEDQFNTKLGETQTKLFGAFETAVAFQGDTTREGADAAAKALTDMENLATNAYANTAAAYGAGLGAMLEDNKVTLREFLVVSLKALQSLVPVFIVQIFGKQLAELGLLGLVSAGIGTAILQGLLGAAANAIANFETGGFPVGTNTLVRVNERGPEFIADHLSTARNRDAFEWLQKNRGADLDVYFNAGRDAKAGPVGLSQKEMEGMILRSEHATRQAMNAGFNTLQAEVRTLAVNIEELAKRPAVIHVTSDAAVKATHTHRFNGPNVVETVTSTQRDSLYR